MRFSTPTPITMQKSYHFHTFAGLFGALAPRRTLFLLDSIPLCALAPLLHLYNSMTTRNTKKNQGLRRLALVVAILAALVSSPDRAPGGSKIMTRRETAGEIIR